MSSLETGAAGTIVRSVRGRDRFRVFMIVGELPENSTSATVLVADGALRRLDRPKKKNLRHLAVLATAQSAGTSNFKGTDSELRRIIGKFDLPVNKKS